LHRVAGEQVPVRTAISRQMHAGRRAFVSDKM